MVLQILAQRACPQRIVRAPRAGVLAFVAAFICLLSVSRGQEATSIRIIDTEAMLGSPTSPKDIVVRGGVEIIGSPGKRYDVYFQVRLNQESGLHLPNGQELFKSWGTIFTPDGPARWTQCRHVFSWDEIAAATNLAKGKTTTLWVVCDLYDPETKKYVAGGWDIAAPLFVTTDAAGAITDVKTAYAGPSTPSLNHASITINAKQCELMATNLKLKEGAAIYRAVDIYGNPQTILLMGNHQAAPWQTNRGYFFGPIDSAEKARELVLLGLPNAVYIDGAEKYAAILKSLKEIPGFDPAKFIVVEHPTAFGINVETIPGYGYRVHVLAAHFNQKLGLRDIVDHNYVVTTDGRMSDHAESYVRSPESPMGAPAGWKPEYGAAPVNPLADPHVPHFNMNAAIDAYNKAIQTVLSNRGSTAVVDLVKVTDQSTTIPVGADNYLMFAPAH